MRSPIAVVVVSLLCAAAVVHTASPASPTTQASPAPPPEDTPLVELAAATIVTPAALSVQQRTAVRVLVEEIEKRTAVRLPVTTQWPADAVPVIAVGPLATASTWAAPGLRAAASVQAPGREGYRLALNAGARRAATVLVLGADPRGELFGVGRLLRELHMTRGSLRLPSALAVVSTPQVALRGHQLGYRPKTNSYDAWDVAMWEQYIRDLAIFGTNAIELIPPRTDDAADSPHFPLPQMEMMIEMSRLADEYGLDVWVWYPAMDPDYGDPKQVESAVAEWTAVLSKLPRVDAVFVPGGDPGHTQPKHLMALLERQTASLHKSHPAAEMWMSPQGFTSRWMDEFYAILKTKPAWLTGIVFGPQVRDSLPILRAKRPAALPDPALSRHHPQHPEPVSGARTGTSRTR